MLHFKLHRVQDWAEKEKPDVVEKARKQFLSLAPPQSEIEPQFLEMADSLWREWRIYEYLPGSSTPSLINEYYLRFRDTLTGQEANELESICRTNFFEQLEITGSRKYGEWIELYGLTTGVKYKVYEVEGSKHLPNTGTLWGRLAKIGQKWHLVGSNPLVMPMITTERMKKMLRDEYKNVHGMSCLYILDFLKIVDQPPQATAKDIKNKRKELKNKFEKLKKEYNLTIPFNDLTDWVKNEKYQKNFGSWVPDFVKAMFFPEEMLLKHLNFLQDIWNYFPHNTLKGKSPIEMR